MIPSGRKSGNTKSNSASGTGTFRLNNALLNELREESQQKRTSLNTLVSQALQSHAEYHTFAAKVGMVSMPKALLIRLMEKIAEEDVRALSEYIAKNELKDAILMMKTTYDSDTVMEFIESWTRAGGYPYRHIIEDSEGSAGKKKHSFIIQHDMGKRWSLFFVELFKFAFAQTDLKIDFQHTANTITFDAEF